MFLHLWFVTLWCLLWFPNIKDVRCLYSHLFSVGLFVLFVFIYVYWSLTRFPYQMMFLSFNRNTTCFISEARDMATLPEHMSSHWYYVGVPNVQSMFFCVVCRSLFVCLCLLPFCFAIALPVLRIVIFTLVSSSLS